MQKSKKMMVSLCGLALSSLFVLNNKSVVHADTVDANNQNSAISWDSDSDSAQNTQKADDSQQNAAPVSQSRAETSNVESSSVQRSTTVQNNAANARTVQDIKVAKVDTAQPAVVKQSQADYSATLSNLGSNTNLGDLGVYDVSSDGVKNNIQSQVKRQLAIDDASLANFNMNKDASGNLTASFGVYSNTAKQQNWWTNVKVNNAVVPGIQWRTNVSTASDGNLHLASTGQPIVYSVGIHKLPGVVIHNPANNQVHVHYVKTDGTDAGIGDFVINISKSGTGSYQIPSGYQLISGDGKYNTNYSSHTTSSFGGYSVHADDSTGGGNYIGKYDPTDPARNKSGASGEDGNGGYYSDSYDVPGYDGVINTNDLRNWLGTGNYTYIIPMSSVRGFFPGETAIIDSDGTVKYSNGSNDYSDGSYYGYGSSNHKLLQSDHVYRILSGKASSLSGAKVEDMGDVSKNDGLLEVYNQVIDGSPDIIIKPRTNYNTVTNSSFSGDSVKSVNGNTVNVVVTKPQHVDPASDARMKATATRTIQINFPGAIPPSYKNIVNDKGVLTQTVTFMRTGQEDALTGDLIDSTLTPWKSNNKDPNFIGFPERTLPKIPGYTLSIKPAQA